MKEERFGYKNPSTFVYIKTLRKIKRQELGKTYVWSLCRLKGAYP